MIEWCHYLRVRTFDMFNISKQPTIVVEVDIVRQRLILRREVGSTVFQEPPLHSIFIFLFFPPDEKEANERLNILRDTDIFHWFLVSWWMQQGCVGSMENERNGISKPSPTTLLFFFLLFDLQLPCLFNIPLCSLWLFTVIVVFPFHPLHKE